MQPRELTIEGLTSFSGRVQLDFTDVSLFALVGPTGAGKSSVVDAMTLALYGRIPRLHANEIAPAISTTASECTVGLTFTVRGRPYRAVRTVRRTKTGASTVEAALEQLDDDGQVLATLAGTADDLTAEVERLLGLTFGEFTRAVVLPQGEFARVLRAQPADRQALLSRLLGVGIYDRVKQRAGAHARSAQDRAEQIAHQIAQLGALGPERIAELEEQLQVIDRLVVQLTADTEQLQGIRDRFRDASDAARRAGERVQRLEAIEPPPEAVQEFADRIVRAESAIEKATATLTATQQRISEAEDGQLTPEQLEALVSVVTLHRQTTDRRQAVTTAQAAVARVREEATRLAEALGQARSDGEAAAAAQAAAHRDHAAVQAALGLQVGDACPVCATTLTDTAPALRAGQEADAEGSAAVRLAAERLADATRTIGTLEAQHARNDRDGVEASDALEQATTALTAHEAALAGQPSITDAQAQIDTAREAQRHLTGLRTEARAAQVDVEKATRERRRLDEQAAGLAARLDRQRLSVAELEPPPLTGTIVEDWAAIHDWAQAQLPATRTDAQAAADAVAAVTAEGSALRTAMDRACAEAGVPPGADEPRDRAVACRADLSAERDRLTAMLELAGNLAAEEQEAREQAVVGAELARLMRTDQFQRWLLDEATQALVAGASTQLRELSNGRYELTLDTRSGSIAVADLANAGTPRSVRTLSGGETFLASLALALSLAQQIAVSASGPVALESLFIDEGFGALDPETLDVAAGAIEQLGAGDRTVGVITHVAEMAERLPTRYVVQRTAGGSRVERVDL